MRKLLVATVLAAFALTLPACTSKSMSLVPPASQLKPMDGGGGPIQNCGGTGQPDCPAPTPTP